jgi:hypothetical protein
MKISPRISLLSSLLLALTAGLILGCSSTKSGSSSAGKSIELFNGKDLAGWRYVLADSQVKMADVWSVNGGLLTCKGEPVGVLYGGPDVTNFRLVVEYRWEGKPGNSGIFSRIGMPVTPLPRAIEVQLMNGNAGDVLGLQGKPVAGGQDRFFEVKAHPLAGDITGVKKLSNQENPAGEWNRVEIRAQGDNYTVWVNGTLVNDVKGVELSAGPVGVQSEGGVIQFRRVTLTPL